MKTRKIHKPGGERENQIKRKQDRHKQDTSDKDAMIFEFEHNHRRTFNSQTAYGTPLLIDLKHIMT